MGVYNLWPILDEVAKKESLNYLEGKTVAIDLSVWIVQAKLQKGLNESKNPHLKNLFYRVNHLLTNNVKPIFVLDGKPPDLKTNAIKERNIIHYSHSHGKDYDGGSGHRERFTKCLKQCEELLQSLGVPCINSNGEAESFCAYLNAEGIVDGCITEDSDAFLYGAKTVYRDFGISSGHEIRVYHMCDIKEKLCMNREKLIALALLLGSDYNKGGINGIGKETAIHVLRKMEDEGVLQRFFDYNIKPEKDLFPEYDKEIEQKTVSHCLRCKHIGTKTEHVKRGCIMCDQNSGCVTKKKDTCTCNWHQNQYRKNCIRYELKLYKKVKNLTNFPNKKIIDEYLNDFNDMPNKQLFIWKCPNYEEFSGKAGNWFGNFAESIVKKILPIITSWQLTEFAQKESSVSEFIYHPLKILKEHVKHKKPFYEVLWAKKNSLDEYTTSERRELFSKNYPQIVQKYQEEIDEKLALKKSKTAKRIPSPAKAKRNPLDLVHNSSIKDFFPIKKKKCIDISEIAQPL